MNEFDNFGDAWSNVPVGELDDLEGGELLVTEADYLKRNERVTDYLTELPSAVDIGEISHRRALAYLASIVSEFGLDEVVHDEGFHERFLLIRGRGANSTNRRPSDVPRYVVEELWQDVVQYLSKNLDVCMYIGEIVSNKFVTQSLSVLRNGEVLPFNLWTLVRARDRQKELSEMGAPQMRRPKGDVGDEKYGFIG